MAPSLVATLDRLMSGFLDLGWTQKHIKIEQNLNLRLHECQCLELKVNKVFFFTNRNFRSGWFRVLLFFNQILDFRFSGSAPYGQERSTVE